MKMKHLKHKYCLAQKLIKCKHAVYSGKSKGQSSCRVIMYGGQTTVGSLTSKVG